MSVKVLAEFLEDHCTDLWSGVQNLSLIRKCESEPCEQYSEEEYFSLDELGEREVYMVKCSCSFCVCVAVCLFLVCHLPSSP